jgi:predicted nuclease with TOPRIM domain
MNINMTPEQAEHVLKYKALYNRLSELEAEMARVNEETKKLLAELEVLRTEEDKLFEE